MEKKTIGSFIAALRKANGMTQKDLAEHLNVSDKTISRWERDEGTPDLSLIPVLAEIFSVSCDELLRGERNAADQRCEAGEESSKRGERQRQRLLAVSLSRYKTRTLIAGGISCAGLIAAMVGNFGFLRAYVGFFLGTAFYLVGIICQVIFLNSAFLSVSEACTEEEHGTFKWSAIRLTEWSMGLTAVLLAFSLPLVVVTGDAYAGLQSSTWFLMGALFAVAALAVVALVCFRLNGTLLRSGVCALPSQDKERYWYNHALKKSCGAWLAVVLAATLLFHAFGSEMLWSAGNMAGTIFEDYDSFIAFMEQEVPYDGSFSDPGHAAALEQAEETLHEPEEVAPEYRLCTLEDANGTVVCEYYDRNQSVTQISYSPKDGTVLPIRVVTNRDYYWARVWAERINLAYCLIYPVEIFAVLLYYRKKRMK